MTCKDNSSELEKLGHLPICLCSSGIFCLKTRKINYLISADVLVKRSGESNMYIFIRVLNKYFDSGHLGHSKGKSQEVK